MPVSLWTRRKVRVWKVGHSMNQTGDAEQEISHRLSKGGWPESQGGSTVLMDWQDSLGTCPVIPASHKSSELLFLPQKEPNQVADAQLDASDMISPKETHGQNCLINVKCSVHYLPNKEVLTSHWVLGAGATDTRKPWLRFTQSWLCMYISL